MWPRRLRIALLFAVSVMAGSAGPPKGKQEAAEDEAAPVVRRLPDVLAAHALALADARSLPPDVVKFTRYVFHPEEPQLNVKTTSLTFNIDSRQPWIRRPVALYGGLLARIDLRWYCGPKDADLAEWLGFWEELAFDPAFSDIVTKDTLNFLEEDFQEQGNATAAAEIAALKAQKVDAIRFNGRHLPRGVTEALQALLGTQAPVVTSGYLKHRLLKTVKADAGQQAGVYQVVFGGRYYEFTGIAKAKDKLGAATKATDLDLFFQGLGIGNIAAGLTFDKLFDDLRSDQRVFIRKSKITGKWRDVLLFHIPAAKLVNPFGAITGDVFNQDIDVGDVPDANAFKPRVKGREAIFPKANGFSKFALFDGAGNRVDEVPLGIAADRTVPDPHPPVLQSASGCLFCHGIFGEDGWKPFPPTSLKPLLSGRLNLFDDRGAGRGRNVRESLDRIAGQHFGEGPETQLMRNRWDAQKVFLQATGPWQGGDGTQSDVVKIATLQLKKEMDAWWYGEIDARQALREEGWDVPEDRALGVFNALHPPEITALAKKLGVVRENPTVAILKSGQRVSRSEWSLAFAPTMARSLKSPYREVLLKESKGNKR